MNRFKLSAATVACVLAAAPTPCFAQNIIIDATKVGNVQIGAESYAIFEEVHGSNKPAARRQFFYTPPLFLTRDNDSQPVFRRTKFGDKVLLVHDISVALNPELLKFAVSEVAAIDPSARPNNVTRWPMRDFKFDIPWLSTSFPQATLMQIPAGDVPATVPLQIVVPDDASADNLIQALKSLTIGYSYIIDARTGTRSAQVLNVKTLKNTNLYAELRGPAEKSGLTTVFVQRDDLRKLAEGISTQLNKLTITDIAAHDAIFEKSLADELLNRWKISADLASFDENRLKSTYNGDDLKPDVLSLTASQVAETQ